MPVIALCFGAFLKVFWSVNPRLIKVGLYIFFVGLNLFEKQCQLVGGLFLNTWEKYLHLTFSEC